jgi:hypothetical protein
MKNDKGIIPSSPAGHVKKIPAYYRADAVIEF